MKINNKYFSHLKIKLPLLLGIFIICIALGSKINLVPNAISIEILSPEDDDVYQLFYDTGNGGFNETNSIKVNIAQSKASKEIIFFELPNSLIKGIRIDLGTKINKNINIKSIKFKHNFCRLNFSLNLYKLSSNEIFKNFKKLNNISVIRVKENQLHITSSGNAPYMVFTGDLNKVYSYICKKILILKIFYYILSLILSIILSYVLDWVILIDLILKISKQSTLLENGLYIVAIYIFSTTMNINNFFKQGKIDYSNYNDYIFLPILHIFLFLLFYNSFLYLTINYNFTKKHRENIKNIVKHQVFLMLIYILYYFSKLTITQIMLYHLILAIGILSNDLIKLYLCNNKHKIYIFYVLLFLSIILIILHNHTWYVFDKRHDANILEGTPDTSSEHAAYNAAVFYNETSYIKYYLLPVYSFPEAPFYFPEESTKNYRIFNNTEAVYAHEPPGPFIILGLLYKIMGKDETLTLNKYRFFPVIGYIISYICLVAFFYEISGKPIWGIISALLIILQPAVDNFKIDLFYFSYTKSLLFIELLIIIKYLKYKKTHFLYLLSLCGFIQAWLCFTFLPLVVLSSFFFTLIPVGKKTQNFNKNFFFPFIFTMIGITLTFILRIIQNSLYYHSLSGAINDILSVASYRAAGTVDFIAKENFYIINLFKAYVYVASGNLDLKFHKYFNNSSVPYFNFPLVEIFILTTLIIGLLAFTNIRITLNCKYLDTTSLFPRITLFLIGCFIAGFAWVALMKNHAAIHLHLIPSQLILLFIGLLVFISVILNEENWCKILYTEEKK